MIPARAIWWSYGIALVVAIAALPGLGGCVGRNPDAPSTERRVMQEAILAGGQLLASIDETAGPRSTGPDGGHLGLR